MPIRIENTGPPITGTACPRNHAGDCDNEAEREPCPVLFDEIHRDSSIIFISIYWLCG